jgi:hypothetical protein
MSSFTKSLLASAVIFSIAGCGSDSSDNSDNLTTLLDIAVSDAPIDDMEKVILHYSTIALLPQDGGEPIVRTFTDADGNEEIKIVDLLEYQGSDKFLLLEDEEVLSGEYKACLFVKGGDSSNPSLSSHVEQSDGSLSALTVSGDGACPQGVGKIDGESVLFFNNAFTVNEQNNDYVIEFDLRGLKEDPRSAGDYQIKRTWVDIINIGETGNLTGTISTSVYNQCEIDNPDNANNGYGHSVYLYEGTVADGDFGDIDGSVGTVKPMTSSLLKLVSNDTEEDFYQYEFGFISPGTYSVAYTCTANEDASDSDEEPITGGDDFMFFETVSGLTVNEGDTTEVPRLIL